MGDIPFSLASFLLSLSVRVFVLVCQAPEEQDVDVVFENFPDDNKKKTIVEIIFEDFSTSPFNSPVASPESKLRNLERSPLYFLREKPKKTYSREFREKAKLALLYDSTPEKEDSDRGSDDIEKEDTYNANENLVPSNQYKIYNYNWDDDDDDISSQDVKMNNSFSINNFPHTSKFPVNKQITQKASGERPELGVDKDAVGVSEISNKNETEEMKRKVNRDEVGKVNNPESSLVSAGFQTANGKTISISEESKRSVQNILGEFQDNLQEMNYETELKDIKARMSIKSMQSKFGKTGNSSAQIAKKQTCKRCAKK
ncbi:uncharacterized protein ACN427_013097 [Glossina fuscipes fuscipes]